MSPIALALNLLLAALLMLALGVGWRLERRLKALRDGHAGFAEAVGDLDRAARRAEVGLAALRTATDEALELLVGRIDKARELATRLEQLTAKAATLAEPAPAPRPRARAPERPAAVEALTDAEAAAEAVVENLVLKLSRHDPASVKPMPRVDGRVEGRLDARLASRAEPRPPPRPRPSIDDDLFDAPAAASRAVPGVRS
jgi:hypothetical protein